MLRGRPGFPSPPPWDLVLELVAPLLPFRTQAESRLRALKAWVDEVRAASNGNQMLGRLEELLVRVSPSPVRFHELNKLQKMVAEARPVITQVREAVHGPNWRDGAEVAALIREADKLSVYATEVDELRNRLSTVRHWVDTIRRLVPASRMGEAGAEEPPAPGPLIAAQELRTQYAIVANTHIRVPEEAFVRRVLERVDSWQRQAREVGRGPTGSPGRCGTRYKILLLMPRQSRSSRRWSSSSGSGPRAPYCMPWSPRSRL